MRLILQKPQWDHTVTGRKGRSAGKVRGAPDQVRSWRKAQPSRTNVQARPAMALAGEKGARGRFPEKE
jgi:hypothetical protein